MAAILALVLSVLVAGCGGSRSASGNDVNVTGTGPTGSVSTGSDVTFVMTVRNIGGNAANDIKLVDQVGNFLALKSITCQASGGAVCPEATSVVMTIPTLPAGGQLVFTVTATVNATSSGTLTNTMTATLGDDVNRLDNSATATASVTATTSNIIVSGTGPAGTVAGNGPAEFVMTVRNDGPDAAATLRITNTVGGNLTLTGITCTASGGALCPATGVVMDVPTLATGGALEFRVQTTVAPGVSGTVVNTMTVTADNDRTREDNSFVATGTSYTPQSGIVVSGTGPATALPAGTTATFVMAVSNAGPDPATDVRIVNSVGGNLTLVIGSMACTASGGATVPTTLGRWLTVPALPANGSLSFSVPAFVSIGTNGAISNTMTATPSTSDTDRSDNTAVAVGSAYSNNVTVTATGPGVPVNGGGSTSVNVIVTNAGPGGVLDVDLANTPGANLAVGGTIVCTPSGGAVCPATTGATMRAPSIPLNGTLNFQIPMTVAAGANGTLVNSFTATAAGDTRSADNTGSASIAAVSANLGVSQDGATTVSAGTSAVFNVTVANPSGGGTANNLSIRWAATAPFALATPTVTCTPALDAICPSTLGPNMTVASLGVGRKLSFTFSVPVPSSGRGAIVATASVTADGDPDTSNNSAVLTMQAADGRNGLYRAYAADGRVYDLTIDFDARQYTMAGNGSSVVRAFAADPSGDFIVGGNERLRAAQDIVVGGHAFSAGVVPYVAARRFSTSVDALAGAYNLMTRNVQGDGTLPETRAGTARMTGNVMQVCQGDFFVQQAQVCDVGSLKSYVVGVTGDVFTGVDTVTGQPAFVFRLARSGASDILLSAGPGTGSDATLQWRIGLLESAGLVGGTVYGPGVYASAASDWLRMDLTRSTYSALGSGINDVAGLFRLDNESPVSMLQGNSGPVLGDATIWVMQSYPLVVVIGDLFGGASGLLQIGVP